MKSRHVALPAVVLIGAMLIGGAALAQSASETSELPDLPGMGVAGRATRGEVARFEGSAKSSDGESTDSSSTTTSSFGGFTGSSAVKADEPVDDSSIRDLPGTDSLPLIGQAKAAFRRAVEPMPAGLAAYAALGTMLSVGSFLVLRRRLSP